MLAEFLADLVKALALGIGELYAVFELVAQDVILSGEIFIPQQEFFVDRIRHTSQQYLSIYDFAPSICLLICIDYGRKRVRRQVEEDS